MYDSYERLTQVPHFLASGNEDTVQRVNYYYDSNPYYPSLSTYAVGRLAAVTFQNEATSQPVYPHSISGSETFIYSYGYNVAGRVTAQQLTVVPMTGYPATLNATYSWDNQGRMTALNYPRAGPQETLSYDAMGNLNTIGGNICSEEDNYGNCTSWGAMQWVTGASYSNVGQLTGFTASLAGLSVANYAYSHYCPVISRTESTGCRDRVNRHWSRMRQVPVKWAFSQKALRSKSVGFGKGWLQGPCAS